MKARRSPYLEHLMDSVMTLTPPSFTQDAEQRLVAECTAEYLETPVQW